MSEHPEEPQKMYVEINRIAGDIYIGGAKKIFAVDFKSKDPSVHSDFTNVDWLIGWAKIGLMSRGHTVPHFEIESIKMFENNKAADDKKSDDVSS